jgi:hypothetical protein
MYFKNFNNYLTENPNGLVKLKKKLKDGYTKLTLLKFINIITKVMKDQR